MDSLEGGAGRFGAQSVYGILGEQAFNDWTQRTGAQVRSRRVLEHGHKGGKNGPPAERPPALDRREQGGSERKQVGGRPDLASVGLLWRDIRRTADEPGRLR